MTATMTRPRIPAVIMRFFVVSSVPRTFISGGYHQLPK
jgi:hypothetical protein